MTRSLDLTLTLCAAITACRRAEAVYVPGLMSASVVELPRLELAAAVLRAVTEQAVFTRAEQMARVPKPRPAQVPVVEIEMRRKRRKKAS